MSLPDGTFIIVVECRDCGTELNRSKPITSKDYTMAVLIEPLVTGRCPKGCRSTASDLNINTKTRWEREDGTPIPKEKEEYV
jgi:hypothetical protein